MIFVDIFKSFLLHKLLLLKASEVKPVLMEFMHLWSNLSPPEDVSLDCQRLLVVLLQTKQRCTVDWERAGLCVTGVTTGEGRRLLRLSHRGRRLRTKGPWVNN